jgi:hypothetical protein
MDNTGQSPVPIKKVAKVAKVAKVDEGYQIELQFNEKAELINVHSTKDMNIESVNNHVIIGALFIAQQLVKKLEVA